MGSFCNENRNRSFLLAVLRKGHILLTDPTSSPGLPQDLLLSLAIFTSMYTAIQLEMDFLSESTSQQEK